MSENHKEMAPDNQYANTAHEVAALIIAANALNLALNSHTCVGCITTRVYEDLEEWLAQRAVQAALSYGLKYGLTATDVERNVEHELSHIFEYPEKYLDAKE